MFMKNFLKLQIKQSSANYKQMHRVTGALSLTRLNYKHVLSDSSPGRFTLHPAFTKLTNQVRFMGVKCYPKLLIRAGNRTK